jgi:hypothetical protein
VSLNCVNAAFWFLYGAAKADVVVWGPNSIGLALGVSQVVLCWAYPKSFVDPAKRGRGRRGGGGVAETEFRPVSTWDADPPLPDDDDDDLDADSRTQNGRNP